MTEQRRSQRFQLRLPIQLLRAGNRRVALTGETRNLSSGGILFVSTELRLDVGQPIEYLIDLPTLNGERREVRLRCMGKVVRREESPESAIAATLERYEFVRNIND